MANEASIDFVTAVTGDGSTPFDTVASEIVKEPQFHRFQDMPLELRQQVYKEYFLDEQESICHGWPHIAPDGPGVGKIIRQHIRHGQMRFVPSSYQQFFPNLCLVNRETGFEAAKFLVSTAELFVEHYELIEPIISKLGLFPAGHLLENIYRLAFTCLGYIYNYKENWDKESPLSLHRHTDHCITTFHACMHFVSQCPQLRELNLLFAVNLLNFLQMILPYNTEETHQTLSFEPIFACKELRKLNLNELNLGCVHDLKADPKPQAGIDQGQLIFRDMGQWFMDEFAARGKKVDI